MLKEECLYFKLYVVFIQKSNLPAHLARSRVQIEKRHRKFPLWI